MPSRIIPLETNKYYHIYNRWYDKMIIYKDKSDFERFIKTMLRYNNQYSWIKIYSYCILPNHFHFVLSSNESGLEISNYMRKIQQWYAMYFKSKYSNSSPDSNIRWQIFEWRFKAKLISNDDYLAKCLAYVNFNAIKHEIVEDIMDYPYTSYHQLANKDKIDQYKDLILDELEV